MHGSMGTWEAWIDGLDAWMDRHMGRFIYTYVYINVDMNKP